jgi:curli production assembly/transport component CsgG
VRTGYTTNEPVQMAVTEAIEKAVSTLEELKMGLGSRHSQPEIDRVLKIMLKENEEANANGYIWKNNRKTV